MKEDYLYTLLENTKCLKERIEIIKIAPYDAYAFAQPGCLADLFVVQTPSEALAVAQAFAQRFKLDTIDRDESGMSKKFMTILDCLDKYYRCNNERYMKLLIDAFNMIGFKRAKYCNEQVLWMDYCSDKLYSKHPAGLKVDVASIPSDKRYRQGDVSKPNKRMR